jgi:NitT/TauT family transport system substrate-binding protein
MGGAKLRAECGQFLAAALFVATAIAAPCGPARAAEGLKVGVLKFGTVNWQLDSLKHNGFDRDQGLKVTLLPLASKNATSVALQAGAVDMIVTDWIWVLRQRAAGADYVFYPYSAELGALMAAPNSGIKGVKDLAGKRIGIAGGPIDKSWLVMRSWAEKRLGLDLEQVADSVFAAPPLLSEQLRDGHLDALLTFWPYAARLEAAGFTRVLSVADLLADLGIKGDAPLVGYVFRERLAKEKPKAVAGFFAAIARANALMAKSEDEWARLRPIMKVESDREFEALKAGYRSGIPADFDAQHLEDSVRLFEVLAASGGEKLLGPATVFDPAVFWSAPKP